MLYWPYFLLVGFIRYYYYYMFILPKRTTKQIEQTAFASHKHIHKKRRKANIIIHVFQFYSLFLFFFCCWNAKRKKKKHCVYTKIVIQWSEVIRKENMYFSVRRYKKEHNNNNKHMNLLINCIILYVIHVTIDIHWGNNNVSCVSFTIDWYTFEGKIYDAYHHHYPFQYHMLLCVYHHNKQMRLDGRTLTLWILPGVRPKCHLFSKQHYIHHIWWQIFAYMNNFFMCHNNHFFLFLLLDEMWCATKK